MSGQKKSIDEIWRELNAPKAKLRQGVAGLAVGLSGLPGITSVVRTKPASSHTPAQPAASDISQPGLRSGPYAASAVGDDATAYLASLQRTINCLADPDRGLRRTAATTLQVKLFTGDDSTPKASPAQLQALLCGPLLRPLVNMLSDSVERCRTTALAVLQDGSHHFSDISPMLPELVPELGRRFGALPVQEPAEEVRLQIAQLTVQLLVATPPPHLARFAPDLAAVMCRSLEDGFPDIKKAGCTAVETAAARVPFDALAPEFERLLSSLAPNLQHQHSRVRLSAIQALDALVAAGAPMVLVESAIVPALRPVGHDRAQPVREAAFSALARWMGYRADASVASAIARPPVTTGVGEHDAWVTTAAAAASQPAETRLPPQAYVPSLLPLLIIGVTDPQPATADLALRLVEGVGEVWAAGNGSSTSTSTTANTKDADAHPAPVDEIRSPPAAVAQNDRREGKITAAGQGAPEPSYVEGSATTACSAEGKSATAEVEAAEEDAFDAAIAARVSACRLGPPYQGRPGAGCRAMVRALLAEHLPPLVRQLGEWTSALRVAAARGLHTTLVLAEEGVARHLELLLPALCSAIADEELEVATNVMASVHVLGAHVAPADWLLQILDTLSPPGSGSGSGTQVASVGTTTGLSLSQRTHTLVVLSGLLHAAGRAARELPPPLLARLAAVLADEAMLTAAAEHGGVRQQLLAVTVNTLALGRGACAAVALPLHIVLLQLYGSELATSASPSSPPTPSLSTSASRQAPPAVGAAVLEAMASFAAVCGYDRCNGGSTADGAAALVDLHADALTSLLFGEKAAEAAAAAATSASTPAAVVSQPHISWRPQAGDAPWQCILRATLLTASPLTLQRLAPVLVSALQPLVSDKDGEVALRLALLQLVDSVLEDSQRGPALATGGGQAFITEVLMPPLVWQAGKTAAAVRYTAVTSMATLLGKRLPLPEHVLAAIEGPPAATTAAVGTGKGSGGAGASTGLLPLLFTSLDEDWYTDMRLAACYVLEQLLEMVGPELSDAARRAIYPELHKRLDDAHNSVRVAACGALRAFVTTAGVAYCDTNTGYLVAGVVIHMDDGDPAVQEAACSVLLAAAAVKPFVTASEVRKVRDRFRSKHYCDRVLAACAAAAEKAAVASPQQPPSRDA
ncbi:hypothetical protein VaNZ11_008788 [Volvox africanus]|uniref:TOG domain-containing protein n=1 Tax=Volvox africanus TaxID=51714 RepID=A0ABQ5S5W8_9CHLO|nr:hypothetical protein VaNZ11_008788 [Volvox africanus]